MALFAIYVFRLKIEFYSLRLQRADLVNNNHDFLKLGERARGNEK
jgi:hypothetical protein